MKRREEKNQIKRPNNDDIEAAETLKSKSRKQIKKTLQKVKNSPNLLLTWQKH